MVNSVEPDALDAVWSGSTLFAQTCLSENAIHVWKHDNIASVVVKIDKIRCKFVSCFNS